MEIQEVKILSILFCADKPILEIIEVFICVCLISEHIRRLF